MLKGTQVGHGTVQFDIDKTKKASVVVPVAASPVHATSSGAAPEPVVQHNTVVHNEAVTNNVPQADKAR
jgi:hypothetical protein